MDLIKDGFEQRAWVNFYILITKSLQLLFEAIRKSNPLEPTLRILTHCNLDGWLQILLVLQNEVPLVLNHDLVFFILRDATVNVRTAVIRRRD